MKVHAVLFAAALLAAAQAKQASPNCGPNQEFNWVTWSCETQSPHHDQDQLVARLLEDGGAGSTGSTGGTGGAGSGCPEDYVSDGAEGCVPASTPTITITRTSGAVEEGAQATYQISLNIRPASPLTVYTTVAGGTAEAEQALQGTITIVNPTPVEVEAGQFAAVQVVASESDALTWAVTIAVAEDDIVTGGGEAFYVAAMVTGSDEAAWSDVAASLNQEYTDDDKNPPVANAGADLVSVFDLEALTADDVQLDGSNSTDPEGLQLYYAWSIKSAPRDAEASLSSADEAKATLTGINKPGQYVAELTVRDSATEGSGLSSTDTATVYVPAVTAASMGSSGVCYSGVDCTLSWTQTGFPANDVSVTVLLEAGEDTEILAANEARNGSAPTGSLTAQVPSSVPTGSYTLAVLITGTFGETLATAARELTVTVSPAVSYVVGDWSTCSQACGEGTQNRTVVCTDYTNTAVPASRCSGLTAPATTQRCFLRPCESFGVRVGAWTACSAACGTAGVRNRTVECLNSDAEVVESSQCTGAGMTVPVSSESCNRFPCEEFSFQILSTSGCNATCGTGTRYQSVVCRGNYGTMLPSSSSKCSGTAPLSFTACEGLPACASFIWTTGSWGACSKPCADAAGAGATTRSVQCIDSTTRAVVGSGNCTAARPASTRVCNAKPCTTYAVTTGAFGQCTAQAGTCQGSRTRAVVCTALYANGSQVTVPRTAAGCTTATGQAASTIATSEACNSCGDCGTPGRAVECSGRGSCSADYKCVCPSGFSGRFCEVSTDTSCASGLKSNRGVCCSAGQSLDASGSCCSAIDRNGVCCAGVVDGCGVCNGDGELDAIGQCCPVAKQDSDGVCCAEELDLLGVCGGVNDGTQQVQSTMGNSGGFTKATISDRTRPDTTRMYSDTQEVFATALQRPKDSVVVRNLDVVGQRRALGAVSLDTRMRMLQSGSIAATTDLKPSGGGDNFVRPDEMAAKLAAAPATGLAAVTGVTSAGMIPTCGNGRCETGERPNAVSGLTGCPADCQFPVVSCPAANGKQCNGKGSCVSGQCVCLGGSGYVGAACDQCDVDFVASSGSCVRVAFAATCGDGVQNGDETGVDCGGSCSNTCASDDDDGLSGGVIALIVIISLVGGGVIFLLFGSTVKAQRDSNAHKAQVQDRSQMPHSQEPDLEVHDGARAPAAGAATLSIASREDAHDSDFDDRDSRANQSPAASVHSRNTEVEHDNLSVGAGSTHSHVHPDHGADIEDEPVAGGGDAYEVDASDEDDRRSQHSNHSDHSQDSDAHHAEPVFV